MWEYDVTQASRDSRHQCRCTTQRKMAIAMKANPRTLWVVFGSKMGSEWLSTRDAFNKLIYLIGKRLTCEINFGLGTYFRTCLFRVENMPERT